MTEAGEVRITRADAEGLARKLEAVTGELSEQERTVLDLILARAMASEPEVGGFAYEAYLTTRGNKQGNYKGSGISQAAGFGPGIDVVTVRLDYGASGSQTS